jgi:RHS repeat-associated protein
MSEPRTRTKYTYDLNNNLTGVTQNAQSSNTQTRSYSYDDLNRMTSEMNPESGPTTYTYDTDTTCGTSKGDLVKKVDAVGDTMCYAYDSFHRLTSVTYPSGPYSSVTPGKYFFYDSANVDGVAMSNAKTRLSEAYTCFSPCSAKLTDQGFSYTVRGETSDIYESTPHSGSYYHVNETYWAHHGVNEISGLSTLPTIVYNVDGEGRTTSASASSGQNPLSSTTYNVASMPTTINLGSSDSDALTYDPNTNRITQYKFNVNGQSVIGNLTWNPLGTLSILAITDPLDSSNTQTCNYSHDDLVRIASANCGSVWSQTFSYDGFGNITKSGSSSFGATYSSSTNRMAQIGSSTPSYDSNGNVTNDFLNTYSWDANGRPLTIDGVGATYDAFGSMVEQNRSGSYTQIVYAPSGGKLALMSGSTLLKGFVYLPGGDTAVYNSSGLAYYRHSDWIGSGRLGSSPTRTVLFDVAYGPFGEAYAQSGSVDLSFTGMNQDTAANVYDFPAREYGTQGRWPSPDPAGVAAVDPIDPQTWNRYAYVRNSPLNAVDPLGLECVWDDGSYDSANDPDTGSPALCQGAGGTWIDPQFFVDFGLSDWSSAPDAGLAALAGALQNGYNLAQFGPGMNGWGLMPSITNSTWSFLGNNSVWWGNFLKQFIKFSGGPGNIPTCAGEALQSMGNTMNPFTFGPSTVTDAAAPAVQAIAMNQSVAQTQASIDGYIAERGLTVPLRSSVVRAMAAQGAEDAVAAGVRANVATGTLAVDYAAFQATITTSQSARGGYCAAAFPIF